MEQGEIPTSSSIMAAFIQPNRDCCRKINKLIVSYMRKKFRGLWFTSQLENFLQAD